MFTPLTKKHDIARAFTTLQDTLMRGATPVSTVLGWKGQNRAFEVQWHEQLRFWHYYDSMFAVNRYWCVYGLEDPRKPGMVAITTEINSPYEGYNRRIGGQFLSDENGGLFLAHSGKVGGGRKGIGKNAFWQFYRGDQIVQVTWPDRRTTEAICIGELSSDDLPAQIAHFVQEVARLKASVSGDGVLRGKTEPMKELTFTPEFSGRRRAYQTVNCIESRCNHGRIVTALATELKSRDLKVANDRSRDLFAVGSGGRMDTLFEVKTDLDSTSLYASIGQLIYNGARQEPAPRRVLVIPGHPESSTQKILGRIGIKVVPYCFKESSIEFCGIDEALR